MHGPVVSLQYELCFCGAREHREYTVEVTNLIVRSCSLLIDCYTTAWGAQTSLVNKMQLLVAYPRSLTFNHLTVC